ncbi:MAG: hypothetical protein ABL857_04690 [Rickettsiales bacterium]
MLINSFATASAPYNKTAENIKQDAASSFSDSLSAQESLQAKSADTSAKNTTPSKTQALIDKFSEWKQEYYQGGVYADRIAAVENDSADFEKITSKAIEQNAYDNPKAFVQSLSPDELSVLQTIHSLANPIMPNGLSKEGALNLLYSPNDLHDIDNDGFQMVGLAKTSSFPPPNAPESVKKAWKETTSNLSGSDKMRLSGMFLTPPGINAFIPPDADYKEIIQKRIEGLEFSKRFAPQSQHETDDKLIAILNELKANLG